MFFELEERAHEIAILVDDGVDRIRIVIDLRGGGHIPKRGVLQGALHILRCLVVSGALWLQIDRHRGGLDGLGDVDDLLQPRDTQCHVLG